MNANVLIAAHEAARRAVAPRYSSGILASIFQYLVLLPIWFVLGIFVYQEVGDAEGRCWVRCCSSTTLIAVSQGNRNT